MEGKKDTNSEDQGVNGEKHADDVKKDYPCPIKREPRKRLRAPVCCIMGHSGSGKTKMLDYIRGADYQEINADRITQRIGLTYTPIDIIREGSNGLLNPNVNIRVPGLLFMDIPCYEYSIIMRSRCSAVSICDIAILVVDIMIGLQPQTIDSLNHLKFSNKKFIVALNQVDKLYGWKTCHNAPFVEAFNQQSVDAQNVFFMRLDEIRTQFKAQGINTQICTANTGMGESVPIVPISSISGEGIPSILSLLVMETQKPMVEKLTISEELQCTVLDVNVVEGRRTMFAAIDVVLVNGVLRVGDQIVVSGKKGKIVTSIQALQSPPPMKMLERKDNQYYSRIRGTRAVTIIAKGLQDAIAGTMLYVLKLGDNYLPK